MHMYYLGTAVTIAPGVTTGQLMQFFLDNNVTFMADVILANATYGGVLSGGCHVSIFLSPFQPPSCHNYYVVACPCDCTTQGVGKAQPAMSDWITSMTIVNGNGEIKRIPEDFGKSGCSPEEILCAASVSLGLFGVVVDITLKVNPMVNAKVKNVFSHQLSVSLNL